MVDEAQIRVCIPNVEKFNANLSEIMRRNEEYAERVRELHSLSDEIWKVAFK